LWIDFHHGGATAQRHKGQLGGRIDQSREQLVVEFGTAFGISGMYWLAGLEINKHGRLLTFEPNAIWADIARDNLLAIGRRFTLTHGTFEEHIDSELGADDRIGIAFIDGSHTSDFVLPQFEIVLKHVAPNGLVVFDDVDFSADMASCWESIARDSRVRASLKLTSRVGIVEVA
jgi:predicted O-methyltransferase YrrM